MELRDRDEALAWLAGGLCLSRLADLKDAAEIGSPWLVESVSESGRIPPPGVVLDFGRLFSGHPLRRSQPLPTVAPPLRAALRSYEDHVLGRIESSVVLDSLIDAFASLGEHQRARAVGVLTASILSRLGVRAVAVSPGVIRRVVASPVDELAASATEALTPGAIAGAQLADGYRELTERAHRVSKLVTDADLFVVENIEVLADLTQRLAISEVLEASADCRALLPKRIKARKRPQQKKVTTSLADEDHYPTGGFSSIATSGSMENLVISELIYMEDPEDPNRPEGVDLFDLRYAEGELLYYTRDESQFVRDHRAVGFVLSGDLVRARIKDRGAKRQRLIEFFGVLHCVVTRLADWLSEQALHLEIMTVDDQNRDRLETERALLEVLFRDDIERGLVAISRHDTIAGALSSEFGDPRATAETVLVTTRKPPALPVLDKAEACTLRIADETPRLTVLGQERDLSGWDDAALSLLRRLV